jgi:membrane protease subunit HflC
MRLRLTFVLLVLAVAVAARTCLFPVDRTEYVYLTQFGRPVTTFDGARSDQAGLHAKWPWPVQSVQSLDRRLQYFDLPGAELLTRDPKGKTIDRTLTIDAYVCWRIDDREGGVDRFIRSVGTPAGAQAILGQRINSELGAAVGRMELEELVNTDPEKVEAGRRVLRDRLLEGGSGARPLRAAARDDYGIEVVDVRLRRLNHPPAVREAIFERIRSERQKKAADYQSEGERLAADVRSAADRRVAELKAAAEAEALRVRGKADAEADRIRNEAARQDPQFYAFLKKLEEYQRILGDGKTVLLLSTHRDLFDLLFRPPSPAGSGGAPPAVTGATPGRSNGGH